MAHELCVRARCDVTEHTTAQRRCQVSRHTMRKQLFEELEAELRAAQREAEDTHAHLHPPVKAPRLLTANGTCSR